MKIVDGERTIGTPFIIVTPGVPAVVAVNKEGGYSMRLTVRTMDSRRVALDGEIYLRTGQQWVPASAPRLQLQKGSQSQYEVLRKSVPSDGDPRFRLEVEVNDWNADEEAASGRDCKPEVYAQSGWIEMLEKLVSSMPPWEGALLLAQNCCETVCPSCCGGRACCSDPWNCP